MAENVKTVQGLAIASVKTLQGLAIASAKTILGVDNTGGGGFAALTHTSATNVNNSDVTTGAIDTTAADLIVCALVDYEPNTQATLTDSESNTWTISSATSQASATRLRLAWCVNPVTDASHTFSLNGANSFPTICVACFSGAHASPLDQENGNAATGSATVQTGSVTPSEDDELLVAVCSSLNTVNSINSSFTITDTQAGATNGGLAYKIQTSAGAENPTWTIGAVGNACARIATFKKA